MLTILVHVCRQACLVPIGMFWVRFASYQLHVCSEAAAAVPFDKLLMLSSCLFNSVKCMLLLVLDGILTISIATTFELCNLFAYVDTPDGNLQSHY